MRRLVLLLALPALLLAGPASASEKKSGGGQSFVQFPTVSAVAPLAGGRRGVITVEVGVDAPDSKVRQRVEAVTPRLRAAYFQAVQAHASSLRPGGAPNADALSRDLQKATDAVVGRAGARVLLGSVIVS